MIKMVINFLSIKQVKESSVRYSAISKKRIRSPHDIRDILTDVLELDSLSVEKFGIINLDVKNQINGIHIISQGTLNATLVHPREVFKAALLNNSNSIILFHNHPSGDPTPSKEDVDMTKRLKQASEIMGIDILDHIIVGDERFVSMKELGLC